MRPWERMQNEQLPVVAPAETLFPPETLAKLIALRARFGGHPEWIEYTMDERRLAFAHWLVERGRLGEDMGENE